METRNLATLARPIGTLSVIRYDMSFINMYRYEIVFEDGRRGIAHVLFGQVRNYQNRDIYAEFQDVGLRSTDTLADLTEFYPNGFGVDEETGEHYMRLGVGSSVLALLTGDAVSKAAKAMFVHTKTKSMRSFLRKKGFTPHGYHETDWYKLLYTPIETFD